MYVIILLFTYFLLICIIRLADATAIKFERDVKYKQRAYWSSVNLLYLSMEIILFFSGNPVKLGLFASIKLQFFFCFICFVKNSNIRYFILRKLCWRKFLPSFIFMIKNIPFIILSLSFHLIFSRCRKMFISYHKGFEVICVHFALRLMMILIICYIFQFNECSFQN